MWQMLKEFYPLKTVASNGAVPSLNCARQTNKTWSHLYSFYSIIRMGPDTTCRSLWSSETARLWPVSKKSEVIYFIRCICRSKEPTLDGSFLLGTKLITNSILGIFGITDHHVTMNKDLGEDRFWFEHFSHSKGKVSPLFYLTPQVVIFSKGKHLDLETLKMWRITNPFVNPDWMEDHLVWVHRVSTAKGQLLQYFNPIYN